MNNQEWKKVFLLAESAQDMDEHSRKLYISEEVSHDPRLKQMVLDLLKSSSSINNFMEDNAIKVCADILGVAIPGEDLPEEMGDYTLLKKIGEGGMGLVFLARQAKPDRLVALKFIRPEIQHEKAQAFFEAEHKMLAMMTHPNIAQIHACDVSPGGNHFFTMEYFPGIAITHYCQEKQLDLVARLHLFCKVCYGVQHAHQKSIVHRDLKPSNILVRDIDGDAVPKMIDFGIANFLNEQSRDGKPGGLLGTPVYMSPEQAMNPSDVDTRSDIYALGGVLYQMLCDQPPFSPQRMSDLTSEQKKDVLKKETPPAPSNVAEGENRVIKGRDLIRDLDWVVARAMAKDRDQRYASAAALAEDIKRFLRKEPVEAVPATPAYKLEKFIAKHRTRVIAAGLVAFSLILGFLLMWNGLVRARAAEREAQRSLSIMQKTNEFMIDTFKSADPQIDSRDHRVLDILDQAHLKLEARFTDEIESYTAFAQVLGRTFTNLGSWDKAETLLQKSLANSRRLVGNDHRQTQEAMGFLAALWYHRKRLTDSEKLYRELMTIQEKVHGPRSREVLRTRWALANIFKVRGDLKGAKEEYRDICAIQIEVLGDGAEDTLDTMASLANTLRRLHLYQEAGSFYRQALAGQRKRFGPRDPKTLTTAANYTRLLDGIGDYEEALEQARFVALHRSKIYREDHPKRHGAMHTLSLAHYRLGQLEEARRKAGEAVAMRMATYGPRGVTTLRSQALLALILQDADQLADAERLFSNVLANQEMTLGPEHPETNRTRNGLARLLLISHRPVEAIKVLATNIHEQDQACEYRPIDQDTFYSFSILAAAYYAQALYPEAEEIYRTLHALSAHRWPRHHTSRLMMQAYYGRCLGHLGDHRGAQDLLIAAYAALTETESRDAQIVLTLVHDYFLDKPYE